MAGNIFNVFPENDVNKPSFYLQNQKQKLLHLLVHLNNNSMLDEVLTNKKANSEAEAGNAQKNMPVRMTLMT